MKRAAPAGSEAVSALLAGLDHPHRDAIERLRQLILSLDPRIGEEVKWNAPSFRLDEHFATFRLHPPTGIRLVLHTGAKARSGTHRFALDDPAGLVTWAASDRCVISLASEAELREHEETVRGLLRQWLAQLPGGAGSPAS